MLYQVGHEVSMGCDASSKSCQYLEETVCKMGTTFHLVYVGPVSLNVSVHLLCYTFLFSYTHILSSSLRARISVCVIACSADCECIYVCVCPCVDPQKTCGKQLWQPHDCRCCGARMPSKEMP